MITVRPSGSLKWVLKNLSQRPWKMLGVLSTESRCLSGWEMLEHSGCLRSSTLIQIEDPPSRYSVESASLLRIQVERWTSSRKSSDQLELLPLFAATERIMSAVDQFAVGAHSLILDVSCLPKRFMFPVIRRLLQSVEVRDLIVIYTVPEHYAQNALSEDPEPWQHLPTFMSPVPEPADKCFIVALGYEPLGVTTLLPSQAAGEDIYLLYPVPTPPSGYQRLWEFTRRLGLAVGESRLRIKEVCAHDPSDSFDQIMAISDGGKRNCVLAPFGPKPVSLGMCLYAIRHPSAVNYTQPRVYNPSYSAGVKTVNGSPHVLAYCIKVADRPLY